MKKIIYERPVAETITFRERQCLCISNTDNLSGENYTQDEENGIIWNF